MIPLSNQAKIMIADLADALHAMLGSKKDAYFAILARLASTSCLTPVGAMLK